MLLLLLLLWLLRQWPLVLWPLRKGGVGRVSSLRLLPELLRLHPLHEGDAPAPVLVAHLVQLRAQLL